VDDCADEADDEFESLEFEFALDALAADVGSDMRGSTDGAIEDDGAAGPELLVVIVPWPWSSGVWWFADWLWLLCAMAGQEDKGERSRVRPQRPDYMPGLRRRCRSCSRLQM